MGQVVAASSGHIFRDVSTLESAIKVKRLLAKDAGFTRCPRASPSDVQPLTLAALVSPDGATLALPSCVYTNEGHALSHVVVSLALSARSVCPVCLDLAWNQVCYSVVHGRLMKRSHWLSCTSMMVLLLGGCHGLPPLEPGSVVVQYPVWERADCTLNLQRTFPGGSLIIDSEGAFRSAFECHHDTNQRAAGEPIVDFSRELLVVFLADGKGHVPKLVRLQRKGDRLTALFGVESYCGGAPPSYLTAVHSFLVRRAPLTAESKVVTLHRGPRCPNNLP